MIAINENQSDLPFIRRKKSSVIKKYSPTHSKSIEEANELAVYLYSLGCAEEAELLLNSYCEKSPFIQHRYERWDAACFAMLFNAHLKCNKGEVSESDRLLAIVKNDWFNPNHWFTEDDFDEFISSIKNGIDELGDSPKSERLQVRAQGYLALLYALYIWTDRWKKFHARESEIEDAMEAELRKIELLLGQNN